MKSRRQTGAKYVQLSHSGSREQASRLSHEGDGPAELNRLFEEAIRCLEGADLPGANAALTRAKPRSQPP